MENGISLLPLKKGNCSLIKLKSQIISSISWSLFAGNGAKTASGRGTHPCVICMPEIKEQSVLFFFFFFLKPERILIQFSSSNFWLGTRFFPELRDFILSG
mgnify:CR=1 FL=1